ncbi:MAG: TetR/AcrR family transcriptional regulator [Actinobacteria bacterium]|nr:TetR/AcrR family transcriptional regulator [Actinomycetota bacterium]
MEKSVPDRLVDASLALLAGQGGGAVTVRAVEASAGVPHGSVRHHFGGLAGLRAALVDGLLAAERVGPPDAGTAGEPTVDELVDWWTGDGSALATARYEVMLMARREPGLRQVFLAARDALVSRITATGVATPDAEALLAMLDGLVLDALLRDRPPDLTLWRNSLTAALAATTSPS